MAVERRETKAATNGGERAHSACVSEPTELPTPVSWMRGRHQSRRRMTPMSFP
jgi:hypothetical protein